MHPKQQIAENLQELAPQAARVAVSSYVGGSQNDDAAVLIRQAIEKLPQVGRLRKRERTIVIGLTHLVGEVPDEVHDHSALRSAVQSLRIRAEG